MKECPYCDKPFDLAPQQPRDERLVALICPICSWRVTVLKNPPEAPPAPPPDPAAARNVAWLVERLPADGTAQRDACVAVMIYCISSIEVLATGRTRNAMMAELEGLRDRLGDRLRALLDSPGKDGAM